jgi:hypothetical protein
MLKIGTIVLSLGLFVGCGSEAARAADIQIFQDPSIPLLSGSHLIHIHGPIEDGDADKLAAMVASLPKGRNNFLLVALSSPGGNLAEGLRMTAILQAAEMQVVIDVIGFGGTAADCAPACSLVYLGGTYRYLQEGSRLSVHQFAFVADEIAVKSETTCSASRSRKCSISSIQTISTVRIAVARLSGPCATPNFASSRSSGPGG